MQTNRQWLRRLTLQDTNGVWNLIFNLCLGTSEITTQEPNFLWIVKIFTDTCELRTIGVVNNSIVDDTTASHLQLPHFLCFLIEDACYCLSDRVRLTLRMVSVRESTRNHIHDSKTRIFLLQIILIQILFLEIWVVDKSGRVTKFLCQLLTHSQITGFIVQFYRNTLRLDQSHHQFNVASQIDFRLKTSHLRNSV